MKYILFFILNHFIFSEEIINITQVACQFIEAEKMNYNYLTKKDSDCEKINSSTINTRNKDFKVVKLKPGKYNFRVKNENIPYEVGFWLRGQGFSRFTLPSISGGGLYLNTSKDYNIELKKGKYLMSCPLNPTPDYEVIVE